MISYATNYITMRYKYYHGFINKSERTLTLGLFKHECLMENNIIYYEIVLIFKSSSGIVRFAGAEVSSRY